MHAKSVLSVSVILALLALTLANVQFMSFVYGIYVVNSVEVSIQKPNDVYVNSTIPLIVNANFRYGTTSTLDEFSFDNITCSYRLDNGEWKNITAKNVTSNIATPDINFWNGFMHKLNVTYATVLEGLSEGVHFINVKVIATDRTGGVNDSDTLTFSVTTVPSHTSNQPVIPASSVTQPPQASPSESPTQTPQPKVPEFNYAVLFVALAIIAITVVVISTKKQSIFS